MTKHEEARNQIHEISIAICISSSKEIKYLLNYIKELEATEKELEYIVSTLKQFRNKWCEIKTSKELNDLCGYFINEVWKDKLSKVGTEHD